jgi:hypothetical protein
MIDTVVLVRQNKKMRERASNLDSIGGGFVVFFLNKT